MRLIEFLRFKQRLAHVASEDDLAGKFVNEVMSTVGVVKLFSLIDTDRTGMVVESAFASFFAEEASRQLRLADMKALQENVMERIAALEATEKDLENEKRKEDDVLKSLKSKPGRSFESKRRRTAASIKIIGAELQALRTELAAASDSIAEDSKNDPEKLAVEGIRENDADEDDVEAAREKSEKKSEKIPEKKSEKKPEKKSETTKKGKPKFMQKIRSKTNRSIFSRNKKSIFGRGRKKAEEKSCRPAEGSIFSHQ